MKAKAIKCPVAPKLVSFAIMKLSIFAVARYKERNAFCQARKPSICNYLQQFFYIIGMFILLIFLSFAQQESTIEAKNTIAPTFILRKVPNIRTSNKKITRTDLQAGQSVPIAITLFNYVEEQLNVEKISISCSCVNLDGPNSEIVIAGKTTCITKFNVKPEDKGALSRDIYNYSNALSKLVLQINILVDVNL